MQTVHKPAKIYIRITIFTIAQAESRKLQQFSVVYLAIIVE